MTEKKPNEQRRVERREEKGEGRGRRAELLLDTQAKEKARQDAIEGRQAELEAKVADLERRLTKLEQPAAPTKPAATTTPAATTNT